MARGVALLGLASLLLGAANGQALGNSKEVHPKVTTYRCTKKDGCKAATNYIVLDSLAHPVHQLTNSADCGGWGSKPNVTACPTKEDCAKNCVVEGIPDYSTVGVTTSGSALRMQLKLGDKVVSPRVYLLDSTEQRYEMMTFIGGEFSFDVDTNKLPCGMNSALYLSEMEAEGGKNALNPGGAYYGTGYCDAQCFVTPFINGIGNIDGKGACCNELDIWEANSRATSIAPHTCSENGVYLCEGAECEFDGVCDKWGCGWNAYKVNETDYYGRGTGFKVDTTRPFSVVTQFPTDCHKKMSKIHRLYVQDGRVIESYTVDMPGIPAVDSLTDEFCKAAGGADRYLALGGTKGMGEALRRGMVLAMSIWWSEGDGMAWLDSGNAGPCLAGEGFPANVTKVEPYPEVTFSNMRWGEIGSTYGKNAQF